MTSAWISWAVKRNASVFLVRLPDLPGGAKQGVDDFLVSHDEEALWDVIDKAPQMRRMDREVLRMNADVAYIKREDLVLDTGTDIWMKKSDIMSIYSGNLIQMQTHIKFIRRWVVQNIS